MAYIVTTVDRAADEARGAVWLVKWDGSEARQLTRSGDASQPRFSPDGRFLSYVSTSAADSKAQIWILDLRGGEARQVAHLTGDVAGYEWSPDGKRLVLSMSDAGADGGFDSSVLIRTVTFERGPGGWAFELRAGAGLVADSDPASERRETETKASAILAALGDGG